ncbi:DnaJ-domain-containing protein [Patellaria atrata CBS 101060]|uniref:DnaJ-domain-containing protein n=1 Tax=Patellaria atrata CBS 101060 TaxID=1346257 RepID=A0A9P4SFQ6_9PEZI|nr:DnaJ-domain-containing protein [Patellaria atrata CBS 101060]
MPRFNSPLSHLQTTQGPRFIHYGAPRLLPTHNSPQCPDNASPLFFLPSSRPFHTSSPRLASEVENLSSDNHYTALSLPHTATASEIKKSFYRLSKKHHPDHNPDDSDASTRFVRISEAYHVLGSPEKRAVYDRELAREEHSHHNHHGGAPGNRGSYFGGHAGSRPASGLSRRRTTFRGPPPSFYQSGGYGAHSAKRESHRPNAHHESSEFHTAEEAASGGFGPGQGQAGYDHDVPHWNREGHFRTQESVLERHTRMKKERDERRRVAEEETRENLILRFIVVGGIVLFATAVGGARL